MSDKKLLLKGNEAIVHGALAASCQCYFGYPITPQNEIPELFSALLPEKGGVFVPAESEVGAANMLLGACACGIRSMTSSSGPGIDLMQEAISYMVGSEVPAVLVNISRGGPGLGNIDTTQADYWQSTRGGSHGAARTLVLAPSTCQECYDFTIKAFDLAFKYRNPVLILGDALVAQLKEPVTCWQPEPTDDKTESWCLTGRNERADGRLLKSVYLGDGELAAHVEHLEAKYASMEAEIEYETYELDDAELVVVAFGTIGRIAHSSVRLLREQGKKVGLFRPITLFPFPTKALEDLAAKGKRFLVIEQNAGQMVDDVRLAIRKHGDADLHTIMPGIFVDADELVEPILRNVSDGQRG